MKKNIFLDIDETLIHESTYSEKDWIEYIKSEYVLDEEKDTPYFNIECYPYIIFLRPKLKEFIQYCFNNFNVVGICTSASEQYAVQIIMQLFELNIITFELREMLLNNLIGRSDKITINYYTSKCSSIYIKNLSLIPKLFNLDLHDTILIDDIRHEESPYSQFTIKCKPFIGLSNDNELETIKTKLDELSNN